jgi:hypothetical protein
VKGHSSFRAFVEETAQTENPASVFSSTPFWKDTENLWHDWPPLQFDGSIKTSFKRAAHCILGTPR